MQAVVGGQQRPRVAKDVRGLLALLHDFLEKSADVLLVFVLWELLFYLVNRVEVTSFKNSAKSIHKFE